MAINLVSVGLDKHGGDPTGAAHYLVENVLRSGRCTDNVTALVVLIHWHGA